MPDTKPDNVEPEVPEVIHPVTIPTVPEKLEPIIVDPIPSEPGDVKFTPAEMAAPVVKPVVELDRTLEFDPSLYEAIRLGKRRFTLRKYREAAHAFKGGEQLLADFGDCILHIQVTAPTEVSLVRDMIDQRCMLLGYKDNNDMVKTLRKYYPDLSKNSQLALIQFMIV